MSEGVSVIICCYNSEKTISLVLSHLQNQENIGGINWEVIVVDNASSDRTSEIAKQSWKLVNEGFTVVREETPGLSHARKKGLQHAKYDFIIFVDDDNLLAENYVATAYQILKDHPEVGLAGGRGNPVSGKPLPDWFEDFQGAYAVGPQSKAEGLLPDSITYLYGAGLIMRKSVWDRLVDHGFQFIMTGRKGASLSSGEDSELALVFNLAGYKLWYDPSLRFDHIIPENRLNWEYVIRLSRQFGKTNLIIDLYLSEVQMLKGWKRWKTRVWILGSMVSLYNLVKIYFAYIRAKIRTGPDRMLEFDLNYRLGSAQQWLSTAGRFRMLKLKISKLNKSLQPGSSH